jgi:hypothetical protein
MDGERPGHSKVALIPDTYSHVLRQADAGAADRIATALQVG